MRRWQGEKLLKEPGQRLRLNKAAVRGHAGDEQNWVKEERLLGSFS